jgi:DNA polymerase
MYDPAKLEAIIGEAVKQSLPQPRPTALARCIHDFETYSEADLKKVGAWVYCEHPSTEIICMSYKFIYPDGSVSETFLWWFDGDCKTFPKAILDHIAAGGIMEAHNAGFERAVWRHILAKRFGLTMPRRWLDTQAVCAYRALPQKLDEVGKVLNLSLQKDPRGKFLINKLCVPQKPNAKTPKPEKPGAKKKKPSTKPEKVVHTEWWRNRDPELLAELGRYCIRDTETEYELSQRVGDLPLAEYKLWCLDQRINDRGVFVDIPAVMSARRIVDQVEVKLTKELRAITGDPEMTHTKLEGIHAFMAKHHFSLASLEANVIDEALNNTDPLTQYLDPMHPDVRRVLEIRRALARASTRKLESYLVTTATDGRGHGWLQYHGAGTGRWAGRLVQPQNFPRGVVKAKDKRVNSETLMEIMIEMIRHENADMIELVFGDVMDVIASSLRGMIIAEPGKVFYVSDFSSIEARVTMWLAGQMDAMEIFAKADRKEGPDIYCHMAESIYHRPINKNDNPDERQLGKVGILGCGYQMSGERLQEQAKDDYNIIISLEEANAIVKAYRETYEQVPLLWRGLEDAAIAAVTTGKKHYYSCVSYEVVNDAAGKWLTCILPNGRRIWYFNPKVTEVEIERRDGSVWIKKQLSYEGRNNKKGGRWDIVVTYGGMLTENVVQAISRDLMCEAMERVEALGYTIILTVHDEIVAEVLVDFGNLKEYERTMSMCPPWANGCPINVEGWRGFRYRKG